MSDESPIERGSPEWQARADRYLIEQLDPIVQKVGWAVQGVFPVGADARREQWWAYTVGLHRRGWPELGITGMPAEQAQHVFHLVVQYLIDTKARPREMVLQGLLHGGYELRLRPCPARNPEYPFSVANLYAGTEVTAMQIVWQDDARRWPWDPDYDRATFGQVLI